MKLFVAMVYADQADDTPEIFAHPDEDQLEKNVHTFVSEVWDAMQLDGEMPDDTVTALGIMAGRVEYSFLELDGYGILSHDTLSAVQGLLIDYEDDRELDLDNAIDEAPARIRREIKRARQIRKQVEEAIK
jgi:hypothetical protein